MATASSKVPLLLLLLLLVGRMPRPAECGCTVCLNGGTCVKSHAAKDGFRCVCPNEGLTEYGLRCEILTRSYEIDSSSIWKYMLTKHDITAHPFESDKLAITFELSASCPGPICESLVLKGRGQKPLLTFAHKLYNDAFTPVADVWYKEFFLWSPAVNDHSVEPSALKIVYEQVERPKSVLNADIKRDWFSVYIHVLKTDSSHLTTHLRLCLLHSGRCFSGSLTQSYSGDLKTIFNAATLSVGKMNGCIRFVRVNGVLVDLGDVRSYESNRPNNTHLTKTFCHNPEFSCLKFDGVADASTYRQNYCGKHSMCQAETSVVNNQGTPSCSCLCTNAKRRQIETISANSKCTNHLLSTNECSKDTPVIMTGSKDYDVKWTTHDDLPIGLGSGFLIIEGSIRTGETEAARILAWDSTQLLLPVISMSVGLLQACLGVHCYTFPQLSVSDGKWHSFSVTIRGRELTAMLDLRTSDHLLGYAVPFASPKAPPVLSIPNSCVRGIRVSRMYLPTGGSDVTADSAAKFIKVHMGSGATAGPDCDLVFPTLTNGTRACNCGSDEVCDTSSGMSECKCRLGYERDVKGGCLISIELIMGAISGGETLKMGFAAALAMVALQLHVLILPSGTCTD